MLEKYPDIDSFKNYLKKDASIIHSPHFENAVVKIQRGKENELSVAEKESVKMFRVRVNTADRPPTAAAPSRNERLSFAEQSLKRQKLEEGGSKPARRVNNTDNSRYIDLSHIGATSNVVERLFSLAGLVLTSRRKSMSPLHFEAVMMLHVNRSMWSIKTVIEAFRKLQKKENDAVIVNESDEDELEQHPDMFGRESDEEEEEDNEDANDMESEDD